ncbi:hypothetical protein [Paraburkholderia fungorum]|uniref:hypothetical protein n=1 Tax=Paraburkholderia fungorum TaxID=134537 RepID=UPI0038B853E2
MYTDVQHAMQPLAGRKVYAVFTDDAGQFLRIDTDTGSLYWRTDAEEDGMTWCVRMSGVHHLLGAKVRSAAVRQLPAVGRDGVPHSDFDVFYGVTIATDHGGCELVYRNSSAGFTRGWITCEADDPAHTLRPFEWRPVTDDWET